MTDSQTVEETPAAVLDPGYVDNILCLVSPMNLADRRGCMELLTDTDPTQNNIWSLGITLSPNQRIENWKHHADSTPAAFKIISVGNFPQTHAEELAVEYGFDPEPNIVTLPGAGNLTGIGIALTDALSEWETTDRNTVICFHSISALLQYAALDRTVRFLETFTGHVAEAGAMAHYHLDPDVHDEEAMKRIRSVFDAVVEYHGDDQWTVTTQQPTT